jgi:hypothetical protein
VVLIGHPNKAGDSYSGSTAWLNAVRSQIVLSRPENAQDPDTRVLTLGKANYARPDKEIAFRWHDFALVLEDELPPNMRADLADTARATAGNVAFLRCLESSTEKRRAVSHNPGVNYFGTLFPKLTEGKGFDRKAFEQAFERLLHRGEIALDQQLWQGANRHWKTGIALVQNVRQPPAPTPCAEPRQGPSQVPENTCAAPRAPTPLYPTDKTGAASWPAAPDPEDIDWSHDFDRSGDFAASSLGAQ